EDGEGARSLAGGQHERADAALEGRDAVLDDAGGRVADPGVDRAEVLQGEAGGGGVRVREHERRRLVDRQGAGAGVRVRGLAGVDLAGLEGPVLVAHGLGLLGWAAGTTLASALTPGRPARGRWMGARWGREPWEVRIDC